MIRQQLKQYFIFFEPLMRFELMTSSLPRKRSTPELQRQNCERETRLKLATLSLEGWCSINWAIPAYTITKLWCKTYCGESRIRTYEDEVSGVTVRPSWPLWYLPNTITIKNMSRWRDSNPRPADYKSAALTNWATLAINRPFASGHTIPSQMVCKCKNILPI